MPTLHHCKYCGKITGLNEGLVCKSCRSLKKRGATYLDPKKQGPDLQFDTNGRMYCKLCGMSSSRLGAHLKKKHGISAEDYARVFGLQDKTAEIRRGTAPFYIETETAEQKAYRLRRAKEGTRAHKAMKMMKRLHPKIRRK